MDVRGSSPARPASESPRRTKPREASETYVDFSDTASACVSDARVFWIAASQMQEIGANEAAEPAPEPLWVCIWRIRVIDIVILCLALLFQRIKLKRLYPRFESRRPLIQANGVR
jgi:hypothetical protein